MFTGIVREIGTVVAAKRGAGMIRLAIHAPQTVITAAPMESVAVNGVCLSVVQIRHAVMTFEIIPTTQQQTALGALRPGARVNLEPSLTLSDRLSGHIVLGHVDGVGRVVKRQERSGELVLTIHVEKGIRKWLVPYGPITVDGVSLTVGRTLTPSTCALHLIPETLRRTTLQSRQRGDRVNIEVDYLAKLVAQFLSRPLH